MRDGNLRGRGTRRLDRGRGNRRLGRGRLSSQLELNQSVGDIHEPGAHHDP
jgi:hypothetical protein